MAKQPQNGPPVTLGPLTLISAAVTLAFCRAVCVCWWDQREPVDGGCGNNTHVSVLLVLDIVIFRTRSWHLHYQTYVRKDSFLLNKYLIN